MKSINDVIKHEIIFFKWRTCIYIALFVLASCQSKLWNNKDFDPNTYLIDNQKDLKDILENSYKASGAIIEYLGPISETKYAGMTYADDRGFAITIDEQNKQKISKHIQEGQPLYRVYAFLRRISKDKRINQTFNENTLQYEYSTSYDKSEVIQYQELYLTLYDGKLKIPDLNEDIHLFSKAYAGSLGLIVDTITLEENKRKYLDSRGDINAVIYKDGKFEISKFSDIYKQAFNISEKSAETEKDFKENTEAENELLKRYLLDNSISESPTANGLYYINIKEGSGEKPKPGDKVRINYVIKLIDGTEVDNSQNHKMPFDFTIGKKEVIDGLDEGICLMRVGGKAKLIVPSKLAYGKTQTNKIPPFSTLFFEIELLRLGD